MRVFSTSVSVMALQALMGLVSRSQAFTRSIPSQLKTSPRILKHDVQAELKVSRVCSQRSSGLFGRQSIRCFSAKSNKEELDASEKAKKLAAAFDEMARKDGFDSTMSVMAEDATFEDDFLEDDFDDDDDDDDDVNDDDNDDILVDGQKDDDILDGENFDLSDFMEGEGDSSDTSTEFNLDDDDDDGDDDDFLDFGGGDDDDMDARIAQAKSDMVKGQISVPKDLDSFANGASDDDLLKLGFKKETNFYGNGETGKERRATLITNAMTCSACGSDFQSRNELKPGFLPEAKFNIQVNLSKIEQMQQLKEKSDDLDEWSPEDEIEFLLQTSGKGEVDGNNEATDAEDIDLDAYAEELGLDLEALSKKKLICKRCHDLRNSGRVDELLRPGWTDEPTLSQEQFRNLLRPISTKPAVIIALIDLFDFGGSVLRELDGIAGENPVILAANKADLMPSSMGKNRIENWVRRELEHMGVQSLANVGGAVRLVSCKTGDGVISMMDKAKELANEIDGDIYVVGAANAGKSTLLNYILGRNAKEEKPFNKSNKRAGNRNQFKGQLMTSPLPGTTLKFIKIDLGDGQNVYDTPGLLVPGTITQLLTPDELKVVCPKKKVEPITFRVPAGKCVLVGGLAKIEVIGDSKPFLLTFFVANDVKLHPTDSERADAFTAKHAGTMLTPPLAPGPERMEEIGAFDSHEIEIDGSGWKEAAADISLTGLGWIAVTGAGRAKLRISVPKGIGISVRPPLMPFDIWEVASKYTGAKAVRSTKKSKTGKRRKGVGRS